MNFIIVIPRAIPFGFYCLCGDGDNQIEFAIDKIGDLKSFQKKNQVPDKNVYIDSSIDTSIIYSICLENGFNPFKSHAGKERVCLLKNGLTLHLYNLPTQNADAYYNTKEDAKYVLSKLSA